MKMKRRRRECCGDCQSGMESVVRGGRSRRGPQEGESWCRSRPPACFATVRSPRPTATSQGVPMPSSVGHEGAGRGGGLGQACEPCGGDHVWLVPAGMRPTLPDVCDRTPEPCAIWERYGGRNQAMAVTRHAREQKNVGAAYLLGTFGVRHRVGTTSLVKIDEDLPRRGLPHRCGAPPVGARR